MRIKQIVCNSVAVAVLSLVGVSVPTDAQAAQERDTCTLREVAVYVDRVHAQCEGADYYYVVPYNRYDASYVDRFTATANAALVAGRAVIFLYETADNQGDQRYPLAITLLK